MRQLLGWVGKAVALALCSAILLWMVWATYEILSKYDSKGLALLIIVLVGLFAVIVYALVVMWHDQQKIIDAMRKEKP